MRHSLLLITILLGYAFNSQAQTAAQRENQGLDKLGREQDSLYAIKRTSQALQLRNQDSLYKSSLEHKQRIIIEQAAERAQRHAQEVRAMQLNMGLLSPAGQRAMRATPEYKKLMGNSNVKTQVAVCMGNSAYTYHQNIACPGLNNCAAGIKPMTATQAQKLGRRPCQRCN